MLLSDQSKYHLPSETDFWAINNRFFQRSNFSNGIEQN